MIGPFGFHPNKTMQVRALPLARALVQRGHAVTLIMPPWQTPQEADKTWQDGGVTVRYVPLGGGVPGIAWRLVREAMAFRPDVVHCFKPKAYSGVAAWWLWQVRRHQVRLVVDTDDWEGWGGWNEVAPYSWLQKRFFARQEQWGMRHCHVLTVASRALETIALSMGIPAQRVVYVPNGPGIEVAVQGSSGVEERSGMTVLIYSRLFEFDVGRLVKVLRGVKTAVPDLSILSVGAGLFADDSAQLSAQFAAAGLLDSVTEMGWVAPESLPATLSQAHVGIYLMEDTLLNRTKCPVKLADMAALGIPVVGEAVGQVPEYVVNGRTGLLRAPGDVNGLTADLIRLLQDSALRQQMAAAAKAHMATHFSWDRQGHRLENVYQIRLDSDGSFG